MPIISTHEYSLNPLPYCFLVRPYDEASDVMAMKDGVAQNIRNHQENRFQTRRAEAANYSYVENNDMQRRFLFLLAPRFQMAY